MTNTKVDLGYDRLMQAKKNYFKLNMDSYELPMNKVSKGIPKWLQEKMRNEGRTMKSKLYEPKQRNPLTTAKSNTQI